MKDKEIQDELEDGQFLTQVGSLPVVQSAMGQLSSLYSRTKETNRLMRFTLETAETGMALAVNTAKPIVTKLPVDRLNAVACNQLETLKESYPVITKPTDQVLAETQGLYEATLKPTVDRVVAVRQASVDSVASVGQYSKDKVNGVKNYTKDAVVGATQYSLATIQGVKDRGLEKVDALLQTPYGQVVAAKVDTIMDLTDDYVEKYLPPTEEDAQNGSIEQEAAVDEGSAGTMTRVGVVSDKVRRRMLNRALQQLKQVRVRSEETLSKLNYTLDLIQFAKNNMDSMKTQVAGQMSVLGETTTTILDNMRSSANTGAGGLMEQASERMGAAQARLGHIWTEINKTESDLDEENETDASKLERRAIATARQLTQGLKDMYSSLPTVAMLPTFVQDKVKEAGSISETLAFLFSSTNVRVQDIPQTALDKTRAQLGYLQELMSFVTDTTLQTAANSSLLNWVMPAGLTSRLDKSKELPEPDAEQRASIQK